MSFIDEVRNDRADLARVLKKHKGIRRIVEDLYPDSAHFIYELLQNAEDARATEATFTLGADCLEFQHNGRPFEERDIWAITDIGEGTKSEDEEKIGRFGVGFKAVFAYTETPHIWSPTYSFRIDDLVLPSQIPPIDAPGERTKFAFPFNNPKKAADDAYSEVKRGLNELAETTLLFLTHLESVRWQVGNDIQEVLRVAHSDHHIEVLKRKGGMTSTSAHFLRFSEPVDGLPKQHIAIAFELEFLPDESEFDPQRRLHSQVRVVPANPGRVAVFFPAEKEASGLRFHLHAPFVPELSRASVKETAVNDPLFHQLANLVATSLHRVRDLKLLTGEFLAVLPNPLDALPLRYEPIRTAIVKEMNNEPLTPVYGGKAHSPARQLLQARATLKTLLSAADLEFLVKDRAGPLTWAISATQKNSNIDRFLSCLEIREWDLDALVACLRQRATRPVRWDPVTQNIVLEVQADYRDWISGKSIEWHQQFYATLYREMVPDGNLYLLKGLAIVRLSTGEYRPGEGAFFPSDGVATDDVLPRVAGDVYSTGKSKAQQEAARAFLEAIGVREVGEAEQVQRILLQRYTRDAELPSDDTYWSDLIRFVDLVEKDSTTAGLFANAYVFETTSDDWVTPDDAFLDEPYKTTGLDAYYVAEGDDATRQALSNRYARCAIPIERLVPFAEAVGVQSALSVRHASCQRNPKWKHLCSGDFQKPNNDSYGRTDEDFDVPEFQILIEQQKVEASRLIWRTMGNIVENRHLTARYQRNNRSSQKHASSRLLTRLEEGRWIPQGDGRFVAPADAVSKLLPAGFPFDPSESWLTAVHFGENVQQASEEQTKKQALAVELGFDTTTTLERAQEFARLPEEEQKRILEEHRGISESEEIVSDAAGSTRRHQKVREEARIAPDRGSELKLRAVAERRDGVKEGADAYLRQYYTRDKVLYCQICEKELPFKLPGTDDYYFEAVEILTKYETSKHHKQNYICLCPTHAAMFRFANPNRKTMRPLIEAARTSRVSLTLAGKPLTLGFAGKHLDDLRAIMEEDQGPAAEDSS